MELTTSEVDRLNFLISKAELREEKQQLQNQRAALATDIATENARRRNSYYNHTTGEVESYRPGFFGSILGSLSAPAGVSYATHGAKLTTDGDYSIKAWRKLQHLRLVIWGRDAFERLDEFARHICEFETISYYEEAFYLAALDAKPENQLNIEFAHRIASGDVNPSEKAELQALETKFVQQERIRKRNRRKQRVVDFLTPKITTLSLIFFIVALWMFLVVAPPLHPLIPLVLAFYADKLVKIALIILVLYFVSQVLMDVWATSLS